VPGGEAGQWLVDQGAEFRPRAGAGKPVFQTAVDQGGSQEDPHQPESVGGVPGGPAHQSHQGGQAHQDQGVAQVGHKSHGGIQGRAAPRLKTQKEPLLPG